MSKHMEHILREGIAQGLLKPHQVPEGRDSRPWPAMLLTAVAAWLSAIPLAAFLVLLNPVTLENGPGLIFLGVLVLLPAIVVLRKDVPLFAEQMSVVALLTGTGLFGVGVSVASNSHTAGSAALIPVVCLIAWLVPRNWLRVLLGAALAALVAITAGELDAVGFDGFRQTWVAWHVVAGLWLGMFPVLSTPPADGSTAPRVAALECFATGIGVVALAGLSILTGKTFMLGAIIGDVSLASHEANHGFGPDTIQYLSSALALCAGAWVARKWNPLRTWWYVLLTGLAGCVAWFLPSLGITLVILAVSVTSGRRVLAVLAAAAAIWMIGGLYYQLAWSLSAKAALLLGVGAALAAVARFAVPDTEAEPEVQPAASPSPVRTFAPVGWILLLSGAVALVAANAAIWDKESLIRNGTPVFVELAPADPRSLMQGDYMALAFRIPGRNPDFAPGGRQVVPPAVVARVDARGVAELLRLHDGKPLGKGEFIIELVRKKHRLVLVTDAWFFREGEADRWSVAKYGEFRVTPGGRALLVGLRGPRLEAL